MEIKTSELKAEALRALARLEDQASNTSEDAWKVWEDAETVRTVIGRVPDELEG